MLGSVAASKKTGLSSGRRSRTLWGQTNASCQFSTEKPAVYHTAIATELCK